MMIPKAENAHACDVQSYKSEVTATTLFITTIFETWDFFKFYFLVGFLTTSLQIDDLQFHLTPES